MCHIIAEVSRAELAWELHKLLYRGDAPDGTTEAGLYAGVLAARRAYDRAYPRHMGYAFVAPERRG
jgi:hypothetical protein